MNKTLLTAILFGAAGALVFILLLPRYNEIKLARATIIERGEVLTKRKEAFKNLQDLQSQYDSHKTDINKLSILLPAKKRGDTIIFGIQTIAAQSGIQLKRISLSPEGSVDSYGSQIVSVDASGTYPSLMTFIATLEKNLRLIDLRSLDVGNAGSGASSVLNISLTLSAYNLK